MARGESGEGFLTYQDAGPGVLELDYIEVPPRLRGTGVAGRILALVCGELRALGVRVIPTCPYIAWWFRQHPEHHDLLQITDQT